MVIRTLDVRLGKLPVERRTFEGFNIREVYITRALQSILSRRGFLAREILIRATALWVSSSYFACYGHVHPAEAHDARNICFCSCARKPGESVAPIIWIVVFRIPWPHGSAEIIGNSRLLNPRTTTRWVVLYCIVLCCAVLCYTI